ncbi:MAG: hypothetical protein D6B28_11875 [Gammaproteobacteria bacterium]|nr:MAG: hypothetical protein D6B28_11875 [Gammaproteobacteria bacterium]
METQYGWLIAVMLQGTCLLRVKLLKIHILRQEGLHGRICQVTVRCCIKMKTIQIGIPISLSAKAQTKNG